jgi:hypothetical protein
MNAIDLAMTFGNLINLMAFSLLMRAVIKDRNVLKGYSVTGTFLTVVAIFSFQTGIYLMGNYISFSLGLFGLAFWIMAFVFSLRNLIRERRKSQN